MSLRLQSLGSRIEAAHLEYISIRQHTSAYVSIRQQASACDHTSDCDFWAVALTLLHLSIISPLSLSLKEATLRQHTSAYVSIRQNKSAYVSIRLALYAISGGCRNSPAYISIRQHTSAYVSLRQHTPAYASIRQHASAYTSV
jgi:hypothetical protein